MAKVGAGCMSSVNPGCPLQQTMDGIDFEDDVANADSGHPDFPEPCGDTDMATRTECHKRGCTYDPVIKGEEGAGG